MTEYTGVMHIRLAKSTKPHSNNGVKYIPSPAGHACGPDHQAVRLMSSCEAG